jgi:protoheme IX farnesyltransferase
LRHRGGGTVTAMVDAARLHSIITVGRWPINSRRIPFDAVRTPPFGGSSGMPDCTTSTWVWSSRGYLWRREELTMKTTAIPVLQLQLPSSSGLTTRLSDFFALMKPRVMLLAVFTAFVGLTIAPGKIDPVLGFVAILAIAVGAGAAGVLNMWYDADIDAVMTRTARRPIPLGKVSRTEALSFGLILAGGAVAVLGLALNLKAAALLAFTIFFYVVVYTAWLKRSTPQNIVIGGAAGALPPVIGWAAATGDVGVEPLILFLIVFLWTPPHFWALALTRVDEYARAGVPMLPVVAGRGATAKQILAYSLLLLPVSILPWAFGFAGGVYGAVAGITGAIFIALAVQLRRSRGVNQHAAHRLFAFSIFYLFLLFAALLIGSANRSTMPLSARADATIEPKQTAFPVSHLQTTRGQSLATVGEV